MNTHSPWQVIGGCCLFWGAVLLFYGGGWLSVFSMVVGAMAIWLGWLQHKRNN